MSFTDVLLIILCVIISFQGLFLIAIYGTLSKLAGMFTFLINMSNEDENSSHS